MCGITGIIARSPLQEPERRLLQGMMDAIRHRGPDGEGSHVDGGVGLGMRRLAIIDLVGGWQPIWNEDRSLAIVCNGEIYNFVELRRELERRGHRYSTASDVESILHLYEEHGDRCVEHLRGMYAFALWDSRRRRVLLCRDRMGEKPLYLAQSRDRIVFASELKALVGCGVVPLELDPDCVNLFLHYGWVPEPRAMVKGVRKLPAGHVLSVDVDSWTIEERCYWRKEDAPAVEGNPVEMIRAELDRIAELIIRSDVPVGVALSGGLDSSAIACLASSKYPGTMEAISLGYAGRPREDERSMARQLTDHLGMKLHEIELSTEDAVRSAPIVAWERDDPIADITGPSIHAIAHAARRLNLPVMLSGIGGDELFWGYGWVQRAAHFSARKRRMRVDGQGGVRDYLVLRKPPLSYSAGMRWLRELGGLGSGLRQWWKERHDPVDRLVYQDLEPGFANAERRARALLAARCREQIDAQAPYAIFTLPQPWPREDLALTSLICDTYMAQNGIAQGDRIFMSAAIELRLPLIDSRLVELVYGLRKTSTDVHLPPKAWLRGAIREIAPEFVFQRRKRGFAPPWRQWMAGMAERYGRQLSHGWLVQNGVLEPAAAAMLARALRPGPLSVSDPLAQYGLALELWCAGMAEHRAPPGLDGALAPASRAPSRSGRTPAA